ncbi:winged helix family transcriptional regulator [Actinobacteria bacterium YIM 96077]|uniref:OmpR/PhoB-type domain-containing protein n=1 Tax=Phytoactinopolyspora halophila TaxID=1981511 RepID=A0A329QV67_9ACTN|nr:winged helix-turn-helix domain-containing protein [Phytoactinopolyspora halophila]AYY12872.1 winged helix family transcriptional regulator [Actinobacteria bacterium YIM 96077]RAW16334.1 hypothetical protein DPM12_06710 [Phytoactinopolyspora halophila]
MSSGAGGRAASRPGEGGSSVSVAGVTLDVARRTAVLPAAGRSISLTPVQAAVLGYLMHRPGRICTRTELMCEALGYPNPIGSRTVDVHIASLRTKLGGALEIHAVRGVGYALDPPRVPHSSVSPRSDEVP